MRATRRERRSWRRRRARGYAAPKSAHGFTLIEEQYIEEYDSLALLYRHDKTGAQLMSLVNDDENKTFGATLRTPVADSKGTPHILEHSVLCGSRKYPIKEPFVELMKVRGVGGWVVVVGCLCCCCSVQHARAARCASVLNPPKLAL